MQKVSLFFVDSLLAIFIFIILTTNDIAKPYGMVVTEQQLASKAGIDILKSGGNAIDAAVAVGYALAVVDPCCGNIGGGGFMTIHLASGKNIFLNFREKAPIKINSSMYLDKNGNVIADKTLEGYLAVAIPGTVLGMDTALKKYGTMSRQRVMQSAIELAEKGYILTPYAASILNKSFSNFKNQPNVAAIFLNHGKPYRAGNKLIQKDLSRTLKLIASEGETVFYKGIIAEKIVSASEKNGGVLSLQDFSQYDIQELKPIKCDYHEYKIISAPPPSSGGVTLCEMTNILENYSFKKENYHSSQDVHFISEAMRYAFFDRNNQLGDPDFVENPINKLLSKKYAKTIAEKISPDRATSDMTPAISITHQSLNTTHYSIVDKMGNAVSVTYSLNSFFGAKVMAEDTGFFLNNEMDDFSIKTNTPNQFGLVQNAANTIKPGKRPLSSMTPTIVLKNNRLFMILGSPGGPRIITSTLETLFNVINYKMDLQSAVDAPRFHHQWVPDTLDYEENAFNQTTLKNLISMGYHLKQQPSWGAVEAILIDPSTGEIQGANDRRRPDGLAISH